MVNGSATADDRERLALLLRTVLPGDGRYPAADALGMEATLCARAERRTADTLALDRALAALSPDVEPEVGFRRFQQQEPRLARRVLELLYTSYYAHPAVQQVLEVVACYPARPPQPLGYEPVPGASELAACAERRTSVLDDEEWWDEAFAEGVDDAVATTW